MSEYIGDGVYADVDNEMIKLETQRENGEHYIYLEPEVFDSLLEYAIKVGWLKRSEVPR